MNEDKIKQIQRILGVKDDGDVGPITEKAFVNLTNEEKIAKIQKILGVKDDGKLGSITKRAFEALDDSPIIIPSTNTVWPKQSYSEMVKFYGALGKNQTSLKLPYQMVLAWDSSKKVNNITCHEKVHDSLNRILQKTLDHYGLAKIKELRLDKFGGCLNVRKVRGGTNWSIHSWGAAVDFDPDRNQLKWGRDKAAMAKPPYDEFWKIVESEKWISLGKARNYDWQHIQAARL
jgi:hypothetical protein